jgi:hypothetical protein
MKTLALTLTLFISVYANAQFTKPTSKLFDAAEGKLIANFSDSIKIAIGQQESGWYPTTTKVIVPKTAVSSDSVLFAEIELLDKDKKVIGRTNMEWKVNYRQAEGRGFYKYYEVIISGYMKSYSIEYKSIPEKGLEDIVNEKNLSIRQEQLNAFFAKMGFIPHEIEDYTAWVYVDDVASFDEPQFRTIVIFRGETSLFCIISKNATMSIEKLKDTYSDNTGNYFLFQRAQEKTLEQMKNIAYSFIPL